MKTYYLIHETTKEHVLCKPGKPLQCIGYKTVEADSEGWIKHTGDECPLPDDAPCLIRFKSDHESGRTDGTHWHWDIGTITHYRPILTEQAEPVKEPDYDPRSVSFNPKSITEMINESGAKASPCIDVITRLSIAHSSAQQIPDLEAELREVLGSMGYDLVARSPFTQQRHGAQENNNEI
jgi:hypothetical protein